MKSRAEAEAVLLTQGWLTYMPEHFQQEVLRRSALREYDAKQPVYRQGDEHGGMYGMVEGALSVSLAPNVHGPYAASFVRPGNWIGGGPAIMDEPRYMSATARARTLLMHLPLAAIREVTASDPVFWRYVAVNVTINLKIVIQRYDDLLISDPKTRVAAVLLRLAGYDDDPADAFANPDIPMSQTEIAEITRLTRNGLGGVLSRLAAEGAVSMAYGHVTIVDPKALMRIVKNGHRLG